MSTSQANLRNHTRLRLAVGQAVAMTGVLVAVGVAVLFLALPGSRTMSRIGHAQPSTAYNTPLIQYRGTGAPPPVAHVNRVGAYLRAEHSYGAVP